ncbi:hypothetical protein SAMN02745671_01190 [Anaerovibrio lipolyticus DSM 3074]|uniref:Uncharacterized protein n=1 Tax=Anaerovibrio lipolyticus DSM 3074 TaxID=1120997 RepID=A0A1M6CMS3_9FIRM|nr:hypothetical protein [Anaerovibrio lipolyticus]SHI62342.1 hypothetical protein SAMN02745671_01190 [Anaerovibrio lipolyticus DSM 3074]
MVVCNDYMNLTKDYLRNIPYYKVAVNNMVDDIRDMEESLKDVSVKIAPYDAMPGGHSDMNETEIKAASREKKLSQYKKRRMM